MPSFKGSVHPKTVEFNAIFSIEFFGLVNSIPQNILDF